MKSCSMDDQTRAMCEYNAKLWAATPNPAHSFAITTQMDIGE